MVTLRDLNDPRFMRKSLSQILKLMMVFISGYMVFKSVGVIANSSSPAVVVLSGSMEPAFQRGDILFLWNTQSKVETGDVVVYDTGKRAIPIVHRVVNEHHNSAKQLLLTKGDNNMMNDLDLYENRKMYLDRDQDITTGVVKGYVPKVGYITILMAENPKIRYLFLGGAMLMSALTE